MDENSKLVGTMRNDADRLEALRAYQILDTPPEPSFDDIVLLARVVCGTPTALVSLVGEDRQWFKARLGFEACETPLEQSVCAHALTEPELLVIPDLTLDSRTAANTLVTQSPFIRFYAGAVLRTPQGVAFGTVCVIDGDPRPDGLSDHQAASLLALARQTMVLFEMRRAIVEFDQALTHARRLALASQGSGVARDATIDRLRVVQARMRLAQEAGKFGTFEIDIDSDSLIASDVFCRIFGLSSSASLRASEIEALTMPSDAERPSSRETRTAGTAPRLSTYRIRRQSDAAMRWIEQRAEFVADERGRPVLFVGSVQDVTSRVEDEERQAALVQLADVLRDANSIVEAVSAASRLLVETLHATRAGYALVDRANTRFHVVGDWVQSDAVMSLVGNDIADRFPATAGRLSAGDDVILANTVATTWLSSDQQAFADVAARALIHVPLMERGRLAGVLFVHDASARTWVAAEVAFVHAVADRSYAAVAKLQAEADQQLFNQELSHRLKNTLAMVQAIAQQTLRGAGNQDAVRAFNLRLLALTAAHDILLAGSRPRASIVAVMQSVFALIGDSQKFRLQGPDLDLHEKAARSLSLLMHELATNAFKYGSLSAEDGRVDVQWGIEDANARALVLTWVESGGPPVTAPGRSGFGSRLIRMGLIGTGNTDVRYASSGLRATFCAPVGEMIAD